MADHAREKESTEADQRIAHLSAESDDYRQRKDAAYEERNRMVAVLSRLWPAHLARHSDDDVTWERDWMTIVCIHSPAGQLTWHVHDSQRHLFAHLTSGENHWDGHSTPEKYERLAVIRADSKSERIAHLEAALRSSIRSMREYLDSDDGKLPCESMDHTGCDPETDRCHRCGWPEHCHDVAAWLLKLELAALISGEGPPKESHTRVDEGQPRRIEPTGSTASTD